MDRDQTRQVPLSIQNAKDRLLDGAPSFVEAFVKDPTELIRRNPREAIGIALAAGIILGIAPKLRQNLLTTAVEAARVFLT